MFKLIGEIYFSKYCMITIFKFTVYVASWQYRPWNIKVKINPNLIPVINIFFLCDITNQIQYSFFGLEFQLYHVTCTWISSLCATSCKGPISLKEGKRMWEHHLTTGYKDNTLENYFNLHVHLGKIIHKMSLKKEGGGAICI